MRTPEELAKARADYPFDVDDPKNGHIVFLLTKPTRTAIEEARGIETGADAWEIIGQEWHIRYDHGAGRSDMKTAAIGRPSASPGRRATCARSRSSSSCRPRVTETETTSRSPSPPRRTLRRPR